jgi:glycine cleavage system protein P-like pyridoxal-binding family
METIDIVKALLDLGLSAILLYFLLVVWNDRKEVIKEKDARIKELSDRAIQIVGENTKTQVELRASIQENTKATETLTARVYEALNKR